MKSISSSSSSLHLLLLNRELTVTVMGSILIAGTLTSSSSFFFLLLPLFNAACRADDGTIHQLAFCDFPSIPHYYSLFALSCLPFFFLSLSHTCHRFPFPLSVSLMLSSHPFSYHPTSSTLKAILVRLLPSSFFLHFLFLLIPISFSF